MDKYKKHRQVPALYRSLNGGEARIKASDMPKGDVKITIDGSELDVIEQDAKYVLVSTDGREVDEVTVHYDAIPEKEVEPFDYTPIENAISEVEKAIHATKNKDVDTTPIVEALERVRTAVDAQELPETVDYSSILEKLLEATTERFDATEITGLLTEIVNKESPRFEIPNELIHDNRIKVEVDRIGGAGGGSDLTDVETKLDTINASVVTGSDFYLRVAMGLVPGYSIINKFGQNNDLNSSTYENINDMGGVYSYPATALITKIDSSAADTSDAEVQGLAADGTLTIQTVTLTGTTPVTLATPLWRVFRIKNVGDTDWVGTVQCVNDADNVTYAQVAIGNNQTLMAQYTVPLGKTGYLLQGTASISDNNRSVAAAGRFLARPYGGVFQLKNTFGISDSSNLVVDYTLPSKMPSLTDIEVMAKGDANGVVVNATFAILLVDD